MNGWGSPASPCVCGAAEEERSSSALSRRFCSNISLVLSRSLASFMRASCSAEPVCVCVCVCVVHACICFMYVSFICLCMDGCVCMYASCIFLCMDWCVCMYVSFIFLCLNECVCNVCVLYLFVYG